MRQIHGSVVVDSYGGGGVELVRLNTVVQASSNGGYGSEILFFFGRWDSERRRDDGRCRNEGGELLVGSG